ncbi:MAG: hypothetical protein FWD15_01020 [Alphaproteobacteria bacterium]|nr:hypothetical protein [Alphaproteobacteria bacterium]
MAKKSRREVPIEVYPEPTATYVAPAAPSSGGGFFVKFLAVILFMLAGAGLFYLYTENVKTNMRFEALSGGVSGNEALDKYLEKIATLRQLDVEEQVKSLGAKLEGQLDAARRNFVARSDMETLSRRVDGVEEYNRAHSGKSMAVLSLAATIQNNARMGINYGQQLRMLVSLTKGDAAFEEDIATLMSFENAAISDIEMARRIEIGAAEIVLEAKRASGEISTWYGEIFARFKNLIKIRSLRGWSNDGIEGAVNFAVIAAYAGDFAGALAALEGAGAKGSIVGDLAIKVAMNAAATRIFDTASARAIATLNK